MCKTDLKRGVRVQKKVGMIDIVLLHMLYIDQKKKISEITNTMCEFDIRIVFRAGTG